MSPVSSFQTLSYNRHNLTADTSERQAKEILIRRRHSLRESIRKDSSLNREHRVSGFTPLGRGRLHQQSLQPSRGAGDRTGLWGAGPRESWEGARGNTFPDVSETPVLFQTLSGHLEFVGEQNYKAPFPGGIHILGGRRPPGTDRIRKLLG